MEHKPKVVETKQISNEFVSYRIVCCDEACSRERCTPQAHQCEESVHTISINADNHDALLQEQMDIIATRHEKMHNWRSKSAN